MLIVLIAISGIFAKPYIFSNQDHTNPHLKYEQAIAENKPIFLEFYGPRCPACINMKPVVANLQKKYSEDVVFINVNTDNYDESKELLRQFPIRFIPAYFYISETGEVVGDDVGVKSYEQMEETIEELLLNQ